MTSFLPGLVVVSDFNSLGTARGPFEADSKLTVNTNTVLSGSRALQSFQSVAGRDTQIGEAPDPSSRAKFSAGPVTHPMTHVGRL